MIKKEKKRKEKYRKIREKNTANKKLVASKALSIEERDIGPNRVMVMSLLGGSILDACCVRYDVMDSDKQRTMVD